MGGVSKILSSFTLLEILKGRISLTSNLGDFFLGIGCLPHLLSHISPKDPDRHDKLTIPHHGGSCSSTFASVKWEPYRINPNKI